MKSNHFRACLQLCLPQWAAVIWLILGPSPSRADSSNGLSILSVNSSGRNLAIPANDALNLGFVPKNVSFRFGAPNSNATPPVRIKARLEGYENSWHEGGGFMFLAVRFFDRSGGEIEYHMYPVTRESPKWSGALKSSPLTHRRESLVVPPNTVQVWMSISSAGPPATVGIYVVENLNATLYSSNAAPVILVKPIFGNKPGQGTGDVPADWKRDGIHSGMAKIIDVGEDPATKAFAIEDNDSNGHAEWRTSVNVQKDICLGDRLVIEWNEMHSVGETGWSSVLYSELPAGRYSFHAVGYDLFGVPDGMEAVASVLVPQPFWSKSWFWIMVAIVVTATVVGGVRYAIWARMQKEMAVLRTQRALEQERLRIARDLHDDLGSRITQISMVSGAALNNPAISEGARVEFGEIRQISRDLVSSLSETVWTVNPEYDHLDALGNYICEVVSQLCKQTGLKCRFNFPAVISKIPVSSQVRHNITMAVKEATHNVIKHAHATEILVVATFSDALLDIGIKDNGRGFEVTTRKPGNGLRNMKQRMSDIGGQFAIESTSHGTQVRLQLKLESHAATPPARSEALSAF